MSAASWIAVDWGTSNLRAWAMGADGAVLAHARSDQGMAGLAPGAHGFEPVLLDLVGGWLGKGTTQVVACGMVGSRQGWAEAGYRTVPVAPLSGEGLTRAICHDKRIALHIVGGISQTNPADVMRGEETQIAGLLAETPGFQGVVAMPGTHTKWVQIVDGEVFHFASFMTGELYALLTENSVLRHSLDPKGFDQQAFLEAFSESLSHPERFAARLFTLRAQHLLHGTDPQVAAATLSGHLLGLEIAGSKPYWLGQEIALMASGRHAERYAAALTEVGAPFTVYDPDACVLAGLRAAHLTLQTASVAS
ncbi:MAG: 2-dehydro-3-deoxygalactonokinase [Pseudomonadota bacterium]